MGRAALDGDGRAARHLRGCCHAGRAATRQCRHNATRCTPPRRERSARRRTCARRTSPTRPSTAPRSRRSSSGPEAPRPTRPCRPSSTRTAARRATTATSGTGTRSTSSTRATPGSRSTSAARPATAASSSGSTTATGAWGTRRTASPPRTTSARSTGSTATGSASSARATARTWRCSRSRTIPSIGSAAPCRKYGDCDILTSWAQGDREGVQDMGRMMAPPSQDPAAYRAGSPVHRLANVEVPLLIAHGELDERVNPKQSEELVAGAAPARRQDVRVRDLSDRGARLSPGRPSAALLPPPRAVPRLVPDVRLRASMRDSD